MEKIDEFIVLSAVDPLNLIGILTPERRVPAIYGNRILYRDGLPIAAIEGGEPRRLADTDLSDENLRTLLARRSLRHPLRLHLRTPTAREATVLAGCRAPPRPSPLISPTHRPDRYDERGKYRRLRT